MQKEGWKASEYRKPLVLRGARQVGKTPVIKEFGSFINLPLYCAARLGNYIELL